ncbi:hypothetical protein GGR56DRAFT_678444 [Xylariaceae sp. FL0804]|nr:hypothetical protein GGR56DRAFT_678444 [Xylariaceae sp. FL0804]
MLSRRSSTPSGQSLKRSGSKKGPAFVCRHDTTTSRLNALLAQIPHDPKDVKTRKCFDCQTATAAGALSLLTVLMGPADAAAGAAADKQQLDAVLARQAPPLLFERLASQRKKIDAGGFRDQWPDVELAFATFCYRRVPRPELGNVCQTVATRFGAGLGRQLLRALVEAACRDNEVWEPVGPAGDSPMFASLNAFSEKLRTSAERVERFAQVEDMFACAEELGRLSCETVSVLGKIEHKLGRWR